MSIEAISWALGSQVGDTTRKMVLVGFANHAHKDGRHAWAAKDTIAEYAECSNKTVRRHVAALIADGWIREGDQRQVAHLRADRRPIVYDLAMNEHTRRTWKAQANAAGQRGDNLTPRHDDTDQQASQTTGGQPDPPPTPDDRSPVSSRDDATGGHTGGQRRPHGGSPVTPEPRTNLGTTPQPPASGGRDHDDDPPTIGCPRHGGTPGPNCRICRTTPRQIEKRRKAQAEIERRAAEQRRLDAARAEREQIRARGRSPGVDQLLADTRRQLARSPR